MALAVFPSPLVDDIDGRDPDLEQRLLARAVAADMTAERDTLDPDLFLVRDPQHRGYVQLATASRCTCSEFIWFERCPHVALVALVTFIEAREGVSEPTIWEAA